jgi:hypothetical protein
MEDPVYGTGSAQLGAGFHLRPFLSAQIEPSRSCLFPNAKVANAVIAENFSKIPLSAI